MSFTYTQTLKTGVPGTFLTATTEEGVQSVKLGLFQSYTTEHSIRTDTYLRMTPTEAYHLYQALAQAIDTLVPGVINPIPEDDPAYPEAIKFLSKV